MAGEVPCATYMALLISMHIVNNGRSSSSQHWKLNLSSGTVEQASAEHQKTSRGSEGGKHNTTSTRTYDPKPSAESNDHDTLFKEISQEERVMGILSDTNRVPVYSGQGSGNGWVVLAKTDSIKVCDLNGNNASCSIINSRGNVTANFTSSTSNSSSLASGDKNVTTDFHKRDLNEQRLLKSSKHKKHPALTCGKPANSSQYDHLRGVSERNQHIHIAEPDVAMVFTGFWKNTDVDIAQLENKLRKAKQDIIKKGNPLSQKSSHVYNLIGNFWRIKGDTQKSVECFRKALSIVPNDPEFLLNLARVLLNLQYLDDAIFLARKSLNHLAASENSWLQHYTLGEILKSFGHTHDAISHFRKSMELNPNFPPTKSQLRELMTDPHLSITHVTLFIILSLVVGVLSFLLLSVESSLSSENGNSLNNNGSNSSLEGGLKSQPRHFNRAMAMRSIKLGINPRLCRLRKSQG